MPKMSERERLAELVERRQKVDQEIAVARERLRSRYAAAVCDVDIERIGEREFREVLRQLVRVGGRSTFQSISLLLRAPIGADGCAGPGFIRSWPIGLGAGSPGRDRQVDPHGGDRDGRIPPRAGARLLAPA